MRILALDVGERRIGLAVCDEEEIIASPLGVIRRTGSVEVDIAAVIDRARLEEAGEIVVGIPTPLSGRPNEQYASVKAFAAVLRDASPVPVTTSDERMTTKIAENALIEGGVRRDKRKQVVDQLAAAVILSGYLDERKRRRDHEA